jgi:homoprotocatechuate degradation regulator HpaR
MRAFSNSLPMALLRAREAVMRRFRPGLRGHGVTEQQWRVLRALAGRPALEITELAAETCLLAPSLSRILPQLEARGLILRQPVPGDLRRASVVLSVAGLALIAAHAPQSEAAYRAIEQRFGAERLAQLFGLLRELERALTPQPSGGARRARPSGASRIDAARGARGQLAEVRKG